MVFRTLHQQACAAPAHEYFSYLSKLLKRTFLARKCGEWRVCPTAMSQALPGNTLEFAFSSSSFFTSHEVSEHCPPPLSASLRRPFPFSPGPTHLSPQCPGHFCFPSSYLRWYYWDYRSKKESATYFYAWNVCHTCAYGSKSYLSSWVSQGSYNSVPTFPTSSPFLFLHLPPHIASEFSLKPHKPVSFQKVTRPLSSADPTFLKRPSAYCTCRTHTCFKIPFKCQQLLHFSGQITVCARICRVPTLPWHASTT